METALSIHRRWSLDWVVCQEMPESLALRQEADRAISLFRVSWLIDERAQASVDENSGAAASEIERLNAKLDLVLLLLGQGLATQMSMPPSMDLRLSATALVIAEPAPGSRPAEGALLSLRVFPLAGMPVHFKWPARVGPPPADGGIQLNFQETAPYLKDELEKFVFMHHRRETAAKRGQSRIS